jgi:hypothetical protein
MMNGAFECKVIVRRKMGLSQEGWNRGIIISSLCGEGFFILGTIKKCIWRDKRWQ